MHSNFFFNKSTLKVKVFKFGGASLKDAAGVKNVASILQRFKNEQKMPEGWRRRPVGIFCLKQGFWQCGKYLLCQKNPVDN